MERTLLHGMALGLALIGAAAAAQTPSERSVVPAATAIAPFPRGDGESARFTASATAVTRALNLCAGLWQAGLPPDIIERDLNGRDPSYGRLPEPLETTIDHDARTITARYLADMPPRIVAWRPVLGCVQLPVGAGVEAVRHLPQVPPGFRAPDLDHRAWPTGDTGARRTLPAAQDAALRKVVDAAFDASAYGGYSWGVVVVKGGHIVAERYAPGFGPHIGSQTHSAAKSFTATIAGIAIRRGLVDLHRSGLLREWRRPADPRSSITLEHLLRMSSGLYIGGVRSVFKDIYTQGAPVADLAATNFLDSVPGARFAYSPADTMLIMRAIREALGDDAAFLRLPYEALYWKIGMTRTTSNGDWNGDIFGSGQTWSTARDFARFGLLYLRDGVWEGERILPEGWARYVATRGPAQPATGPGYGAQFWIHGGRDGLPPDAFTPQGGQGHFAMIIPSADVVIVRRGFDQAEHFAIDRFCADILAAIGS